MKNEFGEEAPMFAPGTWDYMLEEEAGAAPEKGAEEEAAERGEWQEFQLNEIRKNLEDEGYLESAEAHNLVIVPWVYPSGDVPSYELIFFAKGGLKGQTMAEAVKEYADVLERARPAGETWNIEQDVFGAEIGRVRVTGGNLERIESVVNEAVVAHLEASQA
ncbi:hypothetical protein LZC95_19725 [Pendulispora brunnea]|uniref:Uncharacterized protein n=1 Tax=Pendulispora brunnea TaxID=2905690 RepID=A0ABZ2KNX3_9BACT